MDLREQMERIYRDVLLENIPWNLSGPPRLLVKLIEIEEIRLCKAVDLGCGAGNYAVWLAKQGFDVTGIDISRLAIDYARKLAAHEGVTCRFEVADLLDDVTEFNASFELAYDWEVLHHIFPENRERYLDNVHSILRPEGNYFSVCFSEKDHKFGGQGKFRKTRLGTTLYFSSEKELEELFRPLFNILELNTIEIPGKYEPHIANVAWLKRK